jgi:hypothetical protein
MLRKRLSAAVLSFSLMLGTVGLMPAAHAQSRYDYYNNRYNNGFLTEHPYAKKALIGGGVGAVAGGLLAGDGGRADGAIKGALLGAGLGLGYEYLKRRGTFSNW